jgi:hypothetical protein
LAGSGPSALHVPADKDIAEAAAVSVRSAASESAILLFKAEQINKDLDCIDMEAQMHLLSIISAAETEDQAACRDHISHVSTLMETVENLVVQLIRYKEEADGHQKVCDGHLV